MKMKYFTHNKKIKAGKLLEIESNEKWLTFMSVHWQIWQEVVTGPAKSFKMEQILTKPTIPSIDFKAIWKFHLIIAAT